MALFEKGLSENPAGRPKGLLTGRAKALYALEKTLREKPMWFFINVIMPLLPKETKGVLETGDRVIEWKSLVTAADVAAE